MTIRRTDALRTALMEALNTQRGAGTLINVRSGANAGTGGQGTLLAQLVGNGAGWGTTSAGVLTSNAITPDNSADAAGTAGHYELTTSAAVFLESGLLDGSDGVTIDNAVIAAGQIVQISGNWTNTAAYDDGV